MPMMFIMTAFACAGISRLADGRIIVTGGDTYNKTSIYQTTSNAWTAGPNLKIGRGYQAGPMTCHDFEVN